MMAPSAREKPNSWCGFTTSLKRLLLILSFVLLLAISLLDGHCQLLASFETNNLPPQVAIERNATTNKKWFDHAPLSPNCTKIAFDIGANTGKDSLSLLKRGYCVIGIDANPAMIEEATALLKKHKLLDPRKIILLPMAVDVSEDSNEPAKLPFYVTKTKVHSSFELAKAKRHDKNPVTIYVDVYPCEAIYSLIPDGVRPNFMKVDIEERHFACIESLARVHTDRLPLYISWEMHEYAKGLPFPIVDVQLIMHSYMLGYKKMKIVSNRGGDGSTTSNLEPDDIKDMFTKTSQWLDVKNGLERGVPNARKLSDWWDYYMKLER